MTEINEHELNDLIDRLVSGEEIDTSSLDDRELKLLMKLAGSLHTRRRKPSRRFESDLGQRLQELRGSRVNESGSSRHGWFPGWITWRRTAAVAATLVLGLGIAGMTRAVLSGEGPFENTRQAVVDSDDSGDAYLEEKGTAEGAADDRGGVYAPMDMDGASSASSATESLPYGDLTVPELRRVIKTADYEVEVPVGDFQDRFDEISAIAARYGGYVTSADSSVSGNDDEQLKQGVITIRIANLGDNFSQAQKDIEGLGKVVSRQISGEDVTEEYVDLQSRLRNAQAQQASLLALMEKAATIDEILLVQARLDEVQLQIEQLNGSIAYMESTTDYATITVDLHEEDVEAADDGNEEEGIDWGFVEAIKYAGWLAVQTVNFVIIALGVIIPVLVIGSMVSLLVYRLVRRRRSQG